jgi:hypothetical protein
MLICWISLSIHQMETALHVVGPTLASTEADMSNIIPVKIGGQAVAGVLVLLFTA